MSKYPLISELTYDQKCHMAWRADRYTGFGLIQISRLCRGEAGDMAVNEAFEKLDMSPHQAKCHAAAVVKYHPATYKYELRSKKWFISKDDRIVQGLITKREMLETDDHNDGKSNLRRYYLRTDWQGPEWVDEDNLFDSPSALVAALSVPCNFE